MTLHRPSNVDDATAFGRILTALEDIGPRLPLVFPVHPRTRARIAEFGLAQRLATAQIQLIEPLGYLDFLRLYSGARLVLTDSGGIQEETTYLGVPCLTVRTTTERPITVEAGTNRLVGDDPSRLLGELVRVLRSPRPERPRNSLWDGKASVRIVRDLAREFG